VVNPAFRLQIKKAGSDKAATQWIFPAYNPVAQGQEADYRLEYHDLQMGYFTGLEVSHEPGQWLVWAGCVLMGVGLFVAFYMVHMRLWVVAVPDARGKLVLWIGGQANKNKDRFEQKFEEVVDSIRRELDRASIAPPSARKEEEAKLTLVAVK
jgi:cytochrome c biogenesis protein